MRCQETKESIRLGREQYLGVKGFNAPVMLTASLHIAWRYAAEC